MPAVNYDLMLQEMLTKTAGKVNQMIYLINIKDKNGETYDGAKTYRLHVPPNVPIDQY